MTGPRGRPALGALLGLGILLSSPMSARAEEPRKVCPICRHANSNTVTYPTKVSNTLARGTVNTLLGWTELIHEPAEEVKQGGNVFTGILHGIGRGVQRTLAGAGEVLTFWTPKMGDEYLHTASDCPICMGKEKKP